MTLEARDMLKAIDKLVSEATKRGYEISLPEELEAGKDIIIKNPKNGIIAILTTRDDRYFAGGAVHESEFGALKQEWEDYYKEWQTPFGWYIYDATRLPRNHDLAVFEVMWMLERNFLSSVVC